MRDVDQLLTKVRGQIFYQAFEREPVVVEEQAQPNPALDDRARETIAALRKITQQSASATKVEAASRLPVQGDRASMSAAPFAVTGSSRPVLSTLQASQSDEPCLEVSGDPQCLAKVLTPGCGLGSPSHGSSSLDLSGYMTRVHVDQGKLLLADIWRRMEAAR